MYPKAIEPYFAPTTVDAAFRLLAEHRDSTTLLAGGQSLMPTLKLRLVEPGCLIDLNRIPVLWPMRATDDNDWRLAGAAGVCAAGAAPSWTTPSARGRARWPPAKSHGKLHLPVPQRLEARLTLGTPVTTRFPPLPPQLETLFSEASETALVSRFTADML
jgi:FAD binding domain in molybdopterin dehydrogenase